VAGSSFSTCCKRRTGFVDTIRSSRSGVVFQNHEYKFDSIGNLRSREDVKAGLIEEFSYDSLNRLESVRANGFAQIDADFSYDALGNITSKGDVDDYDYTSSRPHAVTVANGRAYGYDAAGNMETVTKGSQTYRAIQYSSFNKPTRMSKGSAWTEVVYGASKNRIRRLDSTGKKSLYVGDMYEEVESGGVVTRIHRVNSHVNFVQRLGSNPESYHEYRHLDHQGSVIAVTTDNSSRLEWLANSPWGERRFRSWGGPLDPDYDNVDSRGYTGHEHLDPVGLIHMNGRVFDPELGRFLSPDPLIQAPDNTQSFNRYSYTFNNPLSYTDPSGYEARRVEDILAPGRREQASGCGYGNVQSGCSGMTRIQDIYPLSESDLPDAHYRMVVVGQKPGAQETHRGLGLGSQNRGCAAAQYGGPCGRVNIDQKGSLSGQVGVSGQLFGGLYGYSVAGGGEADITSLNMCAVLTVCHQFGLGVFLGGGVDASATISADNISSGTYDVWGFFGSVGMAGAATGGSFNFGDSSIGGARGFYGGGKGAAGGVQFCRVAVECLRN